MFFLQSSLGLRKSYQHLMLCLILTQVWLKPLIRKVFGIFLDQTKAFDVVSHDILLDKLHIGFPDNAFEWLPSFLTGRIYVVEIPFVDDSGCLCRHRQR